MDMTKGNVERWYSMNEVCIRDEMISRQIRSLSENRDLASGFYCYDEEKP